jgi:putative transposase
MHHVWWRVAVQHGREQWRGRREHGIFDGRLMTRTAWEQVGAAFSQMSRHQVVSTLDPFFSNRQNDFREMVNRLLLDEKSRHQSHFIKRSHAWQTLGVMLVMRYGSIVPENMLRLARSIFRGMMQRHRTPALQCLNLVNDQRTVSITSSDRATDFGRWARLSRGQGQTRRPAAADVSASYYLGGERCIDRQVNERQNGSFGVGILADFINTFAASRAA